MTLNDEEVVEITKSRRETQEEYWFGESKIEVESILDIPVTLGRYKVKIRTRIGKGDIPWLLGTEFLDKSGAIINMSGKNIIFSELKDEKIGIFKDQKGHVKIALRESKSREWMEGRIRQEINNENEWKKRVKKLHLQFGHCSEENLKKLIRRACDKDELEGEGGKRKLEIVEKECRECNICKKFKRKPRRPILGLNLAENFNEVLAIDLGELEGEKFIVMVDWATRYSQAAWIKSKKPEEMIEKVMEKWVSYFGPPEKILSDGGREFQNEEFAEFAEKQGIELMVTASESPWSNGKCEKVVGLLKEGIRKMREGLGRRELILPWIVSARNGLEMKGGFTPNQKVFGRNINKEKGLEEYTEGDKLRELMIIQEKVRENYLNNESREKIKRALKGKIREHKIEEAI